MPTLKNETLTKCICNKANLVQFFGSMYVHSLTTHTQTVVKHTITGHPLLKVYFLTP